MGKSIAISLSAAQAERLKHHATALGRSSSFVIRQALDEYFKQFTQPVVHGSTVVVKFIDDHRIADGETNVHVR